MSLPVPPQKEGLPENAEASSVKEPVPAARIACWNPLMVETGGRTAARGRERRVGQRHVRRAVEHQPRVEAAAVSTSLPPPPEIVALPVPPESVSSPAPP